MTKRLEEVFGLDFDKPAENQTDTDDAPVQFPTDFINDETLATIEKIENALPQVRGLDSSDNDLEEIAGLAKDAFNNLLDLGMQVDSRFSSEIFAVASTMLGHALTAKTAKINKKLKMIDLQLKKAELDRKLAASPGNKPEETSLGTGTIIDRNEVIRQILENAVNKSSK